MNHNLGVYIFVLILIILFVIISPEIIISVAISLIIGIIIYSIAFENSNSLHSLHPLHTSYNSYMDDELYAREVEPIRSAQRPMQRIVSTSNENYYKYMNNDEHIMQDYCPDDGDTRVMLNIKPRNDQVRAITGRINNHHKMFKKYMGDELEEEESRRWWGNNEY